MAVASSPAERAEQCAQIKQAGEGGSHVPSGKLTKRRLGVAEGGHASPIDAEPKRLSGDAGHIEDSAEGDRRN
jgi:hypothetical protein